MDEQDALARVLDRFGVRLLIQFGSTVKGTAHARSDIDLAVDVPRPLDLLAEFADLASQLQGFFPDHEVDLVEIRRADPLLLHQIAASCRLLAGHKSRFEEFLIYAFKRYQDHRPYFEMERLWVDRFCAGGTR